MITVNGVSKIFAGKTVVNDVSLKLAKGEKLALLGSSGSGKTTILRMINRLVEPDDGEILIEGSPVRDYDAHTLRRKIGYVIQQTGLFPHYTVEENISIVPALLKWPKDKIRETCVDLLERLHLPVDYLDRMPHQLSGGQQQRVGLARAIAANQDIILMDEPFSALDPLIRKSVRDDFLSIIAEFKKTVILVTHDIQEAITFSDHICLLSEGKVQQIGTAETLLKSGHNKFVDDFMAQDKLWYQINTITWNDIAEYYTKLYPNDSISDVPESIHLHSRIFEDSMQHVFAKLDKEKLWHSIGWYLKQHY